MNKVEEKNPAQVGKELIMRSFIQKRFIIGGVVVTIVALIAALIGALLVTFGCDIKWVSPAAFVVALLMTLFLLSEWE
jgi:hypothetical protein